MGVFNYKNASWLLCIKYNVGKSTNHYLGKTKTIPIR